MTLNMQRVAEGITLEWGVPTDDNSDIKALVRGCSALEIRDCDLEELYDMLKGLGWSMDSIMAVPIGVLLSCGLGLNRDDCRYYALIDRYEQRPLFVATLSRVGEPPGKGRGPGVCVLNGFGLSVGYERVSRREIVHTINTLFDKVLMDLRKHFSGTLTVCHVKASNTETLRMWKHLARSYRGVGVDIRITDDPFMKRAYKLVTLNLADDSSATLEE